MGISGFFNYIKTNYNGDKPVVITELPAEIEYEFLFFDFQSGIYNVLNELKEYDYFVRLIYYIKYKLNNQINILVDPQNGEKYKRIINRIYLKFKEFIAIGIDLELSAANLMATCDTLIASIIAKTSENFITYIVNKTYENTMRVIEKHNIAHTNVFIFFDGVPSIAKTKEHISRRIEPVISSNIKNKLYEQEPIDASKFNIREFMPYLSDAQHISIGINTRVITELRAKFRTETPTIFLNDVTKYGEAEHQIMKYINNNGYDAGENKFKGKRILLSSPDADLILFGLIMNSNEYYIDIYRSEFIADNNFLFKFNEENPYKENINYIIIWYLYSEICYNIKKIFPSVDEEYLPYMIKDIAYILLILGDDFLPIIPNIDISNISNIIQTYIYYFAHTRVNIVYYDTYEYVLNIEYFINLINQIGNLPNLDINKLETLHKKIDTNLGNLHRIYDAKVKYYFIKDTNLESIYNKIHMYEKGVIKISAGGAGEDKIVTLSTMNETDFYKPSDDDMIKKYCEGCRFIVDLYFNNNIKNYYWYYPYDNSPRLIEIVAYIERQKKGQTEYMPGKGIVLSADFWHNLYNTIFNYCPGREHDLTPEYGKQYRYFSNEQYVTYSTALKDMILTSIKDEINRQKKLENPAFPEYATNTDAFTYDNIQLIYSCINKIYINKCIKYSINLSDAKTQSQTDVTVDKFQGGFYGKYIKYHIKLQNKK